MNRKSGFENFMSILGGVSEGLLEVGIEMAKVSAELQRPTVVIERKVTPVLVETVTVKKQIGVWDKYEAKNKLEEYAAHGGITLYSSLRGSNYSNVTLKKSKVDYQWYLYGTTLTGEVKERRIDGSTRDSLIEQETDYRIRNNIALGGSVADNLFL